MVSQSAGGPHDNVGFLRQRDGLRDHVETTNQYSGPEADQRAESLELLSDLYAKFTRGRHDTREERLRRLEQRLDHWDSEGRSLTGTRLSKANDVPVLQSVGQRVGLDLGWVLIAHFLDSSADLRADTQVGKGLLLLELNHLLIDSC